MGVWEPDGEQLPRINCANTPSKYNIITLSQGAGRLRFTFSGVGGAKASAKLTQRAG